MTAAALICTRGASPSDWPCNCDACGLARLLIHFLLPHSHCSVSFREEFLQGECVRLLQQMVSAYCKEAGNGSFVGNKHSLDLMKDITKQSVATLLSSPSFAVFRILNHRIHSSDAVPADRLALDSCSVPAQTPKNQPPQDCSPGHGSKTSSSSRLRCEARIDRE